MSRARDLRTLGQNAVDRMQQYGSLAQGALRRLQERDHDFGQPPFETIQAEVGCEKKKRRWLDLSQRSSSPLQESGDMGGRFRLPAALWHDRKT